MNSFSRALASWLGVCLLPVSLYPQARSRQAKPAAPPAKTQLADRLRVLLADPALSDTAVIINEFGEVGIDHLLVERLDDQMVLLSSGCLCCTVRGELAGAMRDLHSRRARGLVPPFRRLVIESTGLADPFPVLSTLKADPVLRHHFRSAGVVTTVDAVNGALQLERGYLRTGRDVTADGPDRLRWPCERAPLPLETSMPGVFATGDARYRSIKRVASAVGDGATAIRLVHEYLAAEPELVTQ